MTIRTALLLTIAFTSMAYLTPRAEDEPRPQDQEKRDNDRLVKSVDEYQRLVEVLKKVVETAVPQQAPTKKPGAE